MEFEKKTTEDQRTKNEVIEDYNTILDAYCALVTELNGLQKRAAVHEEDWRLLRFEVKTREAFGHGSVPIGILKQTIPTGPSAASFKPNGTDPGAFDEDWP